MDIPLTSLTRTTRGVPLAPPVDDCHTFVANFVDANGVTQATQYMVAPTIYAWVYRQPITLKEPTLCAA